MWDEDGCNASKKKDHHVDVISNFRHKQMKDKEWAKKSLKKYIVLDFGSIPLSAKVINENAGNQNRLPLTLDQWIDTTEGINSPMCKPIMHFAFWDVARMDQEPKQTV